MTTSPKSTTSKTQEHPTVKQLVAHQVRLGKPDNSFARTYLSFSGSAWNLIKSGKYPADPDKLLERCEGGLRQIEDEQHAAAKSGKLGGILHTDEVTALLTALRNCATEKQNRLVTYYAPVGGGKSTFLDLIEDLYGSLVVRVEAKESWRSSYFAALCSIGAELKLSDADLFNVRTAEKALFDTLKKSPRIIAIDEGEHLGPPSMSVIKGILNLKDARNRVVLVGTPKLKERMTKAGWVDTLPVLRRTYTSISLEILSANAVSAFMSHRLPTWSALNGESGRAADLCRAAANLFGHYDTLERIAAEIHEQAPLLPVTLDTVASAVANVESLRR